ncbi:MAG: O-antigen ligase family protein [Puniceicoccales bacterium]
MQEKKSSRRRFDASFEKVVADKPRRGGRDTKPIGTSSATPFGHFLVLFALFGLVLAGGGKFVWSHGLFLVLVGFALVIRPPERTLHRRLDWTVIILAVIGLMSFFPIDWFGFLPSFLSARPSWWNSVSKAGIDLPATNTPQPLRTLEALSLLAAGISFLYLLINTRLRTDDRWRLLLTFTLVGGVLAGLVFWGTYNGYQYPLTERAMSYSFFDNRNQTSILLVMIGMVALSITFFASSVKWYWGLIAGMAYIAAGAAVSVSLSKGGLLLFLVGSGFWIITRFVTERDKGAVRFIVPLIALSFAMMLITGQQTLSRFSDWMESDSTLVDDFRTSIYQDAIGMVAVQPAAGVGLGNFADTFTHYRNHSVSSNSIIHPESDWLWIAAEMGVPGLSIMATLVFLLFWLIIPFGGDRSAVIRGGALMAVVLLLIQSFFDVSGHRLGIILFGIWLYRLAIPKIKLDHHCKFPRWLWRLGGVAMLAIGGLWILADSTDTMLHSAVAKRELPKRVKAAMDSGKSDSVSQSIKRALLFSPLDWQSYIHRAQADLYLTNDTSAARENFARARALEPVLVEPALYEGEVWLPRSTHYAYDAWNDAIRRETGTKREVYAKIIHAALKNERFARDLDRLSQSNSEFRTSYLGSLQGRAFLRALSEDLRRTPNLEFFSPSEREAIILMWLQRGDAGELLKFLQAHPSAVPNAWYFEANAYGRLGNYPKAIEIASEYAPAAQIPALEALSTRPIKEQRALYASDPTDIVRGGMLLNQQISSNDSAGARWTLDRLLALKQPPLYAYYWSGELYRLDGNPEAAWKDWNIYLHEVIERKMELKSAEDAMFGDIQDVRENPLVWEFVDPLEKKKQ